MQADSVPPLGGVIRDVGSAPIGTERVEADSRACMTCGTITRNTYYLVNDQRACEACAMGVPKDESTGLGRFTRAFAFGTCAAALSAGLWYAVSAWTGYELGLIALVVGLAVGIAVRVGSRERGGWLYQTMAVGLTYLAIVSTYVPMLVESFAEAPAEAAPVAEGPAEVTEAGAVPPLTPTEPTVASTEEIPTGLLYAVAIPIAIISPILMILEDFLGSLMWLMIIGIALFEAWKVNQGNGRGVVKGPFSTAS